MIRRRDAEIAEAAPQSAPDVVPQRHRPTPLG